VRISSRDRITLLIASAAGVAFWYLAQFSGSVAVIVLYAVAIIPLVISRAERRYPSRMASVRVFLYSHARSC
jgi:hypothetical protein